MQASRIEKKFKDLANRKRSGLGIFITACDPNLITSQTILENLPSAGADFIELGMPFSDPMADGPSIQLSSIRALNAGASLKKILLMVKKFRLKDNITPLILMGYFNPIYSYGVEKFLKDAKNSGVDGFIIVDLPPEEDEEFCIPALKEGLDFIRLVTPTTNNERLKKIIKNGKGFIYYVAVTGITGTKKSPANLIKKAVKNIKTITDLPIAVGFGIRSTKQVEENSKIADASIVGSHIIDIIEKSFLQNNKLQNKIVNAILKEVKQLSSVL